MTHAFPLSFDHIFFSSSLRVTVADNKYLYFTCSLHSERLEEFTR